MVQLLLCQDHLLDLEKQLEAPSEDGRIRVLKGDDPKPEELTSKVEEVVFVSCFNASPVVLCPDTVPCTVTICSWMFRGSRASSKGLKYAKAVQWERNVLFELMTSTYFIHAVCFCSWSYDWRKKEEKLLEKDLIFEEVNRLLERTKKKAETGKEDTLNLAKKVGYTARFPRHVSHGTHEYWIVLLP